MCQLSMDLSNAMGRRARTGIRGARVRAIRTAAAVAVLGLALAGCSTWSTASVKAPEATPSATTGSAGASSTGTAAAAPTAGRRVPVAPSAVMVTTGDVTDRPYDVLGDIAVTVNKTTLFHPDPTPALVDAKLREEAAALGADAVILVKYGKVGVSFFSWGSLDGSGRAVKWR